MHGSDGPVLALEVGLRRRAPACALMPLPISQTVRSARHTLPSWQSICNIQHIENLWDMCQSDSLRPDKTT
jgi:hypothetical protein